MELWNTLTIDFGVGNRALIGAHFVVSELSADELYTASTLVTKNYGFLKNR